MLIRSVVNFRDMGGAITRDGRRVRYGILYRSGMLSHITEADKKKLIGPLGIRYLHDYRDEMEAADQPDPPLEGVLVSRTAANIAENTMIHSQYGLEYAKKLFEEFDSAVLRSTYARLPFKNPSYRALLDALRYREHYPLLHHCTAGRDRTGVGAALILGLLGVPDEVIEADYLESNNYLMLHNEQYFDAARPYVSAGEMEQLRGMVLLRADFIRAALDAILDRYGGFSAYFLAEHSLDKAACADIRSICLEPI